MPSLFLPMIFHVVGLRLKPFCLSCDWNISQVLNHDSQRTSTRVPSFNFIWYTIKNVSLMSPRFLKQKPNTNPEVTFEMYVVTYLMLINIFLKIFVCNFYLYYYRKSEELFWLIPKPAVQGCSLCRQILYQELFFLNLIH